MDGRMNGRVHLAANHRGLTVERKQKKITNEKKKRRKSREAERDGPANECAVPDSGAAGLRRDLICRLAGVLLRETPSVVVATPTANVRRPAPYPPPHPQHPSGCQSMAIDCRRPTNKRHGVPRFRSRLG